MFSQNVKLILSPFNPNVEVVGTMLLSVRPPYNDKSLVLVVNPNITHYEDQPKITEGVAAVRQVMVSEETDETQKINFSLGSDDEKTVESQGKRYKVKLLNIGRENIQGQDFSTFEFYVEGLG